MMHDIIIMHHRRDTPELLYGTGEYVSDTYRLSYLGKWRDIITRDHMLNDYHNFLQKIYGEIDKAV